MQQGRNIHRQNVRSDVGSVYLELHTRLPYGAIKAHGYVETTGE